MDLKTHRLTDTSFCGQPAELQEGYSRVVLETTPRMAVDDYGLVHLWPVE